MAYSETTDMLIDSALFSGTSWDPQKFVDDAADEIDSHVGGIYDTPLDTTSMDRASSLLIKRISNHLATGRYLIAATGLNEHGQVDAYGLSLVKSSLEALAALADGSVPLRGLSPSDDDAVVPRGAPAVRQQDPESATAAFYDRITNPSYPMAYDGRPGFVNG